MTTLSDEEKAIYEWQMWLPQIGEEGQKKLKGASALVSRCGGLGGPVCYNLAAAGIGRLIIAHGGTLKPGDLNRQILMTHDGIGKPRIDSAARRLKDLNPRMEIVAVNENISSGNVERLVTQADIVFDCAPLFSERMLMNQECVRQRKPMIESAVFGLEAQVTTFIPGQTPCLSCLYPEAPPHWKRQFPVLAAVPAMAASIAALEGIKQIVGFGKSLAGTLLYFDGADISFQRIPIARRPDCAVCGKV